MKTLLATLLATLVILAWSGDSRAEINFTGKAHERDFHKEAEEAARHDNDRAAREGVAPEAVRLSPPLMALLRREMALLQDAISELPALLATGEFSRAAHVAQEMSESFILKRELTGAQAEELHRTLPALFVEMDRSFHEYAARLARAAVARDAMTANLYLFKLSEACMECHARYATHRFPGLAGGGAPVGHHGHP